jgi:hypothetical protein
VSQLDLYSKDIPLSGNRVSHDQETDVFIAQRITLPLFRLVVTHSNVIIRAIISILAQVSNSTVVVIIAIEAKVSISDSFSIAKALVFYITNASFIIVEAGSPPLLLLLRRVDQLYRPASRGEEEKQD